MIFLTAKDACNVAPLAYHVGVVIGSGAYKQMVRTNTRPNITVMANEGAFWNRTNG